jgi:hypothetical protein
MSTFYFSGIEKRSTAQVLSKAGAAGMMSQLQYSPALLADCDDIPLVLDSGAYTHPLGKRDIEKYAGLISKLGTRCEWYAGPDCIGNQEKSNQSYAYLLSLLPERLHPRILWIYQYGSDLKYLEQGLQQHHMVGIGGLVPLQKNKQLLQSVVMNLAEVVRKYNRIPHYFGLSTPDIFDILRSYHESFSVDSTTWLVGGKFGLAINSQGQQYQANGGGYDYSTSAILEQNVRTMNKWMNPPIKKVSKRAYQQMSFEEVICA